MAFILLVWTAAYFLGSVNVQMILKVHTSAVWPKWAAAMYGGEECGDKTEMANTSRIFAYNTECHTSYICFCCSDQKFESEAGIL